ncbi:MAG TPA: hypothetical protein VGG84_02710 [Gemmatimonadaceae bacterium]
MTALAPSRLKGMNQLGRRAFTAALFVYGVYDLSHPGRGGPLDLVDLPIHETGHLVFMAFGEFIHIAGGTLFQLIMPALFLVYFWRRGDKHAASVMLWWIAQNCGNIAVYAADARAQELPLVGGGEHDWANMLGTLGLLAKDQEVARGIRGIGWVLLFVSTAWGLVAAQRSEEVEGELAPDA